MTASIGADGDDGHGDGWYGNCGASSRLDGAADGAGKASAPPADDAAGGGVVPVLGNGENGSGDGGGAGCKSVFAGGRNDSTAGSGTASTGSHSGVGAAVFVEVDRLSRLELLGQHAGVVGAVRPDRSRSTRTASRWPHRSSRVAEARRPTAGRSARGWSGRR